MAAKKTPAPLPWPRGALRVGLEVGLPAISIFDGEKWIMLPVLSVDQALRFCKAMNYSVPEHAHSRIRAGQIVTLLLEVKP